MSVCDSFLSLLNISFRGSHELFSSCLRDSVMEILFEQDNEEKSVASLILDALVKVEKMSHSGCNRYALQ